MKSRLCAVGVLVGLLPAVGWPDAKSYQFTGFTSILSSKYAARPQWSPDGQWILYDDHEQTSSYDSNPFKAYRMHPDGTGVACLTCGRSEAPANSGGAQLDPTGRYVVFTAEQADHYILAAGSSGTDPGGGFFNDVAILDLQTQAITRIHVVGSGLDGETPGGSLFPRFSHAGSQIAWSDYVNAGTPEDRFGAWRILVADFVPAPQPHLENLKSFTPGPRPEFYEIQGWMPDDQALLVSCATLPGQDENALGIAQMYLATGQLQQLTSTSGVRGQPAEYEEHADLTSGGDALAIMSSAGYGISTTEYLTTWLKTELWLANYDGTQPQQLTFFNVPGQKGYNGQRAVVSMISWAPDASALVANVYYFVDADHPAPISDITVFSFNKPTPSITSIIYESSFGGFPAVAPGSFIQISGVNMAGRTNEWGNFFVGDQAPAKVDAVTVTIDGQPGYVSSISPSEVDVQVPASVKTGETVQVVLTYEGKSTSPLMLAVRPLQPGLLAPPAFKIGGIQYVAAVHADGSFVGNGRIPGFPSTPAKPGEEIVFYGIGFGPANDMAGHSLPVAGQIITVDSIVTNPVQFLFGQSQEPGTIAYSGMAPNYTGVYQFNVVVPANAPNGDLPLTVTQNGSKLSQTVVLSVHN